MEANPCVSDAPSHDISGSVEAMPGLFPTCAITHAIAWRALNQVDKRDKGQLHTK